MIFVTVGTHEQQFNRLLNKIDNLKGKGIIRDEVFIQSGFSTDFLKNCGSSKFLTYDEMNYYIEKANLVITHGGPASFLNVLIKGKPLIVVPRKVEFNEHVNNHQVTFLKMLNQRGYDITYVDNINDLESVIQQKNYKGRFKSNSTNFSNNFIELVQELVKE